MDYIKEQLSTLHKLRSIGDKMDQFEVYDLIDFVADTYDVNLSRLQEEYIRSLSYISPFIERGFTITDEMEWPYQTKAILEGEYPIEKLPLHLRGIAYQLYYCK